ncbi:MAG: hypothetical protein O2954_08500 [bacterium]|nr:hypothetical protein [bacterium]
MPTRIPLVLEEPTGVRRENWPVRRGVPFPQNVLATTDAVRLIEPNNTEHPCEIRQTAHWPDNSVKWILLDFQVTLNAQETALYHLEYGEGISRTPIKSTLTVSESQSTLEISTGPLSFSVSRTHFNLLENVRLHGRNLLESQAFWIASKNGTRYDISNGTTHEVTLEEHTAQRAVIRATGTFGNASGKKFFRYLVRLTAHANLPWLETELTFFNTENAQFSEIQEIAFNNSLALEGPETGLCGSGRKLFQSQESFYFYHEKVLENYGVFSGSLIYKADGTQVEGVGMYEQQLARGWLDVSNQTHGVCISMRDFVALYPKEAGWKKNHITFSIHPARSGPLNLHQGQSRTHIVLLQFHEGGGEEARVHEQAIAFEESLLPQNSAWYLESGVFGLVLPPVPERYPKIERNLRDQTVQARNTRSLGMVDFGDFVNPGTGSQGGFSSNNEPDRLHGFLIQHIRTGERIPWQLVESSVWHTIDIDMVHYTTHDPLELGGQRIHGHHHVQYSAEGYPGVSTVPSHMWTEGLLEYYFLTGHPRALEAAISTGDCFLKMVDRGWAQPPYHSNWHSARDSGWPLIGLAAVYEATGEEKYRLAMRSIFEAVRDAQHKNGGWSMELFFNTGFCPFQNAVCLTGLGRYHETTGDEEARDVFLKGMRFLAGKEMRFPDGAWIYVTSHDYRSSYYSDSPVEPFGYAYRLTRDKTLIQQVLRGWTRNLDLRASPRFLWAAHEAGLLEDSE